MRGAGLGVSLVQMGPIHPYVVRPPARQERTESKAVASLVLGLLSMGCGGPIAGVPAIILGSIARRDIDRSNGQLAGRGIAAGGIVSGLFGTGLGLVLVLWFAGAALTPETPDATDATASIGRTAAPPPSVVAVPSVAASGATETSGTRTYGSLEVVDVDESRPLRAQLAEIVKRSRGRTIVLQTYAKSSPACAAVAAALPDKRMQGALANVTLVRVDVDEYEIELNRMFVETRTAPWFYKLDAQANPTDALSADGWDANVPENMAPILRRFVHTATTSSKQRTRR